MSKSESVKITMTTLEMVTEFHPAIIHLGTLSIKNVDVLLSIMKVSKIAKEKLNEYQEVRAKIAEVDCKKDKAGKPVLGENNEYQYAKEKSVEEVKENINELHNKKLTITVSPILLTRLRNVDGLTANTIIALREFIKVKE